MPVRYKPDGTFEFDTPEEAMNWYKLLPASGGQAKQRPEQSGKRPQKGGALPSATGKATTKAGFFGASEANGASPEGFISLLNRNGRKIIKALAEAHPSELSTEELSKQAGIAANKLGPMFRHLYKAAEKAGLQVNKTIIRQESVGSDGKYRSTYGVSKEVANAMRNHA